MANYRQIHVSIWKDEWFLDLEPQAKLLFVYLFSNESTSLSGLYKLPLKVIAFETGLDRDYILKTLGEFSKAGKAHYQDGVVWVVHMRRYHETKSDGVRQRIQQDIDDIPDCELKRIYLDHGTDPTPPNDQSIPCTHPVPTLVSPCDHPFAINLKEKEEEKEDEQESEARAGEIPKTDPFDVMLEITQRVTGLMPSNGDVELIRRWAGEGVIEADLRDALAWRKDNGKPPVRTITGLAGGVEFARSSRIQSSAAKASGSARRVYTVPEVAVADEEPEPEPDYDTSITAVLDEWKRLIAAITEGAPKKAVQNWIKPLFPVSLIDDTLTIRCVDKEHVAAMDSRFKALMGRYAVGIFNRSIDVRFMV